jgi:hypothetical protein
MISVTLFSNRSWAFDWKTIAQSIQIQCMSIYVWKWSSRWAFHRETQQILAVRLFTPRIHDKAIRIQGSGRSLRSIAVFKDIGIHDQQDVLFVEDMHSIILLPMPLYRDGIWKVFYGRLSSMYRWADSEPIGFDNGGPLASGPGSK